ncbi:MAG: rRNA methyltransferase [Lysobacterales bacterium CG_4_9_14_3_um_filter_62_6]|nr:MAG: rRNA methyltransferase [Xanthomonadales bacterium CG_4_9_14_3_um_filter_62_6]
MHPEDPWRNARQHAKPAPARGPTAKPALVATASGVDPRREQRQRELRLFGVNACLAVFAQRPQAIRKIYLLESMLPRFRAVLAWCAQARIGYRLVAATDLVKLTQSEHHEGVCFEVLQAPPLSLEALLEPLKSQSRSWLVWLDGVGNPHNFGAILRTAAHFGCHGLILSQADPLELSGAAVRVAEGGAEVVPIARVGVGLNALATLKAHGYQSIATVVRDGANLFQAKLSPKLVLLIGAEATGLSAALIAACDQRLAIPGTGAVDSLNVAAAFAVCAARIAQTR